MLNKNLLLLLFVTFLMTSVIFAHGGEDDGHDEMPSGVKGKMNVDQDQMSGMSEQKMGDMGHDMGHSGSRLSHQVQMVLPFSHFVEGHWFAGIVLTLLWISILFSWKGLKKK
jgi:hypothetical protein